MKIYLYVNAHKLCTLSNIVYTCYSRTYGNAFCKDCAGSTCSGHYLMPKLQIDKALKGEELQCVPPPSEVLKQLFSDGDYEDKVDQASITTLLPPDKVCTFLRVGFDCNFVHG